MFADIAGDVDSFDNSAYREIEIECIACYDDTDCNDGDDYTYDYCVNPGNVDAYCRHDILECISDLDCLGAYLGAEYCIRDEVWQDFFDFSCIANECVENLGVPGLIKECDYTCSGGECIDCDPYETRSFIGPMVIRDFVNSFAASEGNTWIPDQYNGQGAVNFDAVTADYVCELAGFNTVVAYDSYDVSNGRRGFHSCHNNVLARWNPGLDNFDIINACTLGNQWISTLTCGDPIC